MNAVADEKPDSDLFTRLDAIVEAILVAREQLAQTETFLRSAIMVMRADDAFAQAFEVAEAERVSARNGNILLSISDLAGEFGLSRQTIYTMRRQGRFPQHVEWAGKSKRWRRADVDAWLEGRSRLREQIQR